MACSVKGSKPPSPLWGGTDEAKPRQGGATPIITNREEASAYPTLAASLPVPPHKGEGGGRRAPILRAREFRKNLTPQEARLWIELQALRAVGFHFRRQAPFRGYFLNFVCFNRRLVVEVDGGGHAEDIQADHDAVRDAVLKRQGFQTLRVWNSDINTNLDGVMTDILAALQSAQPVRSP
jgi:very-short-patch-repair endonuclease